MVICQPPLQMGEKIAVKNGQIFNFQGLVTLPLDRSYCIPSCTTCRPLPTYQISLKLKELFVDGWTFETHFIRSTQMNRPKKHDVIHQTGSTQHTAMTSQQNRAIGNIHKKMVKITHVDLGISSQTDRQTHKQMYSSQYFCTPYWS